MILFSHPTGNANVRAALIGLLEAGLLREFHTTIASYPGNVWDVLGRCRWGGDLQRRAYDERLRPFTIQHPFREVGRMLASRLNLRPLGRHESGIFSLDAIYRAQDGHAAGRLRQCPRSYSGVYTYEDGALDTLAAAQAAGLKRIYELPIAFWQTLKRLLAEETERLPAWKTTLGGGVSDSEAKLNRKSKELELAEMVICPSRFVADSLPDSARAKKKIVIAPFGSPPVSATPRPVRRVSGRKLRILFAGSLSQRKGLGDVFAAMRLLNRHDVELVVMGAPQAPMEFYRGQFGGFSYEPGRSHAGVLELMRSCDVFCLPSVVEGRALVMQEAMSQGLPLIITRNTGGEDLIDEGITGFLVPIRDPVRIAEKISWFADHRSLLPDMSRAAKAKAAWLTWDKYRQTIVNAIRELPPS